MNLKEYFIQTLPKGMVTNFGKLFSANVIAQIVGLLTYPLITRIYSPDELGIFNIFTSTASVLLLLHLFEYHNGIVLPKEEKDAAGIFHLGIFLTFIVGGITCIFIPFSDFIAEHLFHEPRMASFIWMIPLWVIPMSIWGLYNNWLIRHKRFGNISTFLISQNAIAASGKIGLGKFGFTHGGLIVSAVLSAIVSLFISIFSTPKEILKPLFVFDKENLLHQAKRYWKFPAFTLPHTLINAFTNQLPVFLITIYFSSTEVGFFGLARTITLIPVYFISSSIYQVLYQDISERVNNQQSILPFLRKVTFTLFFISVIGLSLIAYFLPTLTAFIFGEEWQSSGEYIQVMLPWIALTLTGSPITFLYGIFFKQGAGLFLEITSLTLRSVALWMGLQYGNILFAIGAYSMASAIIISIQIAYLFSIVRKYENSLA